MGRTTIDGIYFDDGDHLDLLRTSYALLRVARPLVASERDALGVSLLEAFPENVYLVRSAMHIPTLGNLPNVTRADPFLPMFKVHPPLIGLEPIVHFRRMGFAPLPTTQVETTVVLHVGEDAASRVVELASAAAVSPTRIRTSRNIARVALNGPAIWCVAALDFVRRIEPAPHRRFSTTLPASFSRSISSALWVWTVQVSSSASVTLDSIGGASPTSIRRSQDAFESCPRSVARRPTIPTGTVRMSRRPFSVMAFHATCRFAAWHRAPS